MRPAVPTAPLDSRLQLRNPGGLRVLDGAAVPCGCRFLFTLAIYVAATSRAYNVVNSHERREVVKRFYDCIAPAKRTRF